MIEAGRASDPAGTASYTNEQMLDLMKSSAHYASFVNQQMNDPQRQQQPAQRPPEQQFAQQAGRVMAPIAKKALRGVETGLENFGGLLQGKPIPMPQPMQQQASTGIPTTAPGFGAPPPQFQQPQRRQ